MEQLIEEYGIAAVMLLLGSGVLAAFGHLLTLLAGV